MLLTKPPADVTWDDVQQFCERQLVESKILDYKREFPKHFYVQRDAGPSLAKVSPTLNNLHDDPRWRPFLEKLGLAD